MNNINTLSHLTLKGFLVPFEGSFLSLMMNLHADKNISNVRIVCQNFISCNLIYILMYKGKYNYVCASVHP